MKKTIIAGLVIGTLGACSLAPDYKVPEMPLPTAYKEAGPWQLAVPADNTPRGDWWQLFGDATLNALEKRLNTGNMDLAAALARYDAAKANSTRANASLFPEIGAIANPTRNRQSDHRPLRGSNQPNDYDAYTAGLGTSYELDLWGKVRNLVSAGKAAEEASAADVESVKLTLQAELATNYFLLRGLDAQAQLLAETVAAYKRQLELTDRRHQEGIASGLDVSRAKTQLSEVRAQHANVIALRALYEHAIATLVGEIPSQFSIALDTTKFKQPDIPLQLPSTLLQRRPDIAAAERRVAAANAEIGVARAALFPSISLGASGGYQSTAAAGLFTAPNLFWSIGPAALLTLFDAGRRSAAVDQAKARLEEESSRYRGVVLRAFKEVEDNLVLIRQQKEEISNETEATTSARRTYELALNRYREGAVSYLEVVDAETAKLRTERAAIDINTRGLLASVGLIRALGGDWKTEKSESAGNKDQQK